MSVQKGERRKMYDNIDYSVEVNSIKRLAPSASRYNFRSGGSRVNTAALRKLSQYRKLRWQERKLKEDICEMSSQLAAGAIQPLLPWLLAFAAGAMLYVVVEELIPEAHLGEGHMGTVGVMLGFLLMMILDVALG